MAEWWRGAVIYQIYPRSFLDTNADGIGDLAGITRKLDYIAALGVDGVWLSPFYRSPMKDFGYDVSDYLDVDPIFGTLADFDTLLAEAHHRGLKVVIDQVWSHSSNMHPWFVESSGSRDNPKADWYVWADPKPDGTPPNNWLASFGGPAWTWSPLRRQYYLHNFLPEQPDLNYWNPEVREQILNVAKFWLDRGVDGFRLDVINYIVHDQELRDNPPALRAVPPPLATMMQRHVFDRSRPEALDFIRDLRRLMDGYGGRMTVGEIGDEPPLPRQQEYTAPPDRLHTAYSFYLLQGPATPERFAQALSSWADAPGWPSWSLGNHDVARYASRIAREDPSVTRTLMAALLALRGTIFLYQGEELGLPQGEVPFELLRDPYDINSYPAGEGRDGARTPIPWLGEPALAGFSDAALTWLPVDPNHRLLAADRQEGDPASMLNFTRRLIALRQASPALKTGEALLLDAPLGVLAFERRQGDERVICLFELDGRPASVRLPGFAEAEPLFMWHGACRREDRIDLAPFAGALLRIEA
ncbi:MAG: alpha glucosidase [Caulobacteraceae bacterium]|nr:alpha glucosidase [Caulobacteraceae bacterium]